MSERTLSVLDGNTFVVGDRLGDLRTESGREHGFFSEDTRFVSHWVLRVDDAPLDLLGLDEGAHFAAQFFLTPRVGLEDEARCSVMRRRCVDSVIADALENAATEFVSRTPLPTERAVPVRVRPAPVRWYERAAGRGRV